MKIRLFNLFVKVTGWLPYKILFRTKIYYENKRSQSRRIKGAAIIISNHTSVFDYAIFLFVFIGRTLRYQMAEVLFRKKLLKLFLKLMGGIFVDRESFNFSFVGKSEEILENGGVVGIFPEARLPRKGEERPLPFKPSAAYIAMKSGAPIIPVYTNGAYFTSKRARVIIGEKMYAKDYIDPSLEEKENIERVNRAMRQKIVELENEFNKRQKKS